MKRSPVIAVSSIALWLSVTGCAPRFVEIERTPRIAWVERPFVVESAFLQPSPRRELVQTELTGAQLGPMERVRWIEGINPNSHRIQRATERHGAQQGALSHQASSTSVDEQLVQAVFFGVHEGRLSAEGELALNAFQGRGDERYFVEFLYAGPMDEVATREMTALWVDLSKRLVQRGADPKNFVMGGSKYNQRINAVALLKVGN
ncbi:hypothetical protein [Allochromatium tepidum]|uniref:Lipoprotein n=1 Tax=Allochromatium tepidum TaxID=553982 RepID=A0ABN6GEW0_9GAMM|nr:hypothetical protein [Allochromatium tepidum]BCU08427.1 hypothetical protein Atep_31040 [Allochromatium tepidum]